jgi:hypothetical protein
MKPIQIETVVFPTLRGEHVLYLFALCEDGTIWRMAPEEQWKQIPEIVLF